MCVGRARSAEARKVREVCEPLSVLEVHLTRLAREAYEHKKRAYNEGDGKISKTHARREALFIR